MLCGSFGECPRSPRRWATWNPARRFVHLGRIGLGGSGSKTVAHLKRLLRRNVSPADVAALQALVDEGKLSDKLARHLSDAALGELGRQMGYKAGWYGLELVKADRWYASSKTCSACGVKNERFDREPVFCCADDACGHRQDRDENAAVNLARWTAPAENQEETLPLAAAA
jgi:transposase